MKSPGPVLSYSELRSFAAFAQKQFEGAQLQEIWANDEVLVFQFYKFTELYLLISLQTQQPRAAIFKERPLIQKKTKPVVLFLNAHAKNLRWEKLWTQAESGRVLFLSLTSKEKECEVEIHLIPRNTNLLVRSGDKKISWESPRELPTSQPQPQEIKTDEETRDWWEESRLWQAARSEQKKSSVIEIKTGKKQDPRSRALEKKQKALLALQAQLESDEISQLQKWGELLKSGSSQELPQEASKIYDPKISVSRNMQKIFAKAKDLQRKRQGVLARFDILKKEISELEKSLKQNPEGVPADSEKSSLATKLMEKSHSQGRKKNFSNGIEAVLGKSAEDNLAILRQAQPWHFWLHLKDEPSAHAIILRGRNQNVPSAVIEEVAEWIMKVSAKKKNVNLGMRGGRYEVIVVECRYVRPIKGDRLGRVTYHHPQVFSFASKFRD